MANTTGKPFSLYPDEGVSRYLGVQPDGERYFRAGSTDSKTCHEATEHAVLLMRASQMERTIDYCRSSLLRARVLLTKCKTEKDRAFVDSLRAVVEDALKVIEGAHV